MRATKLIVLTAGLIGLGSFFLPLISVDRPGISLHASALEILQGLDVGGPLAARGALDPEVAAALERHRVALLALYAPALLLLAFGLFAVAAGFGRALGLLTLFFAILQLGIYSLLATLAGHVGGLGLHLLVVPGLVGFAGGLVALIKPET